MKALTLGQGSGGRLTQDLIAVLARSFGEGGPREMEDCALLTEGLAVTIDGFTVSPRLFPGGDIGKLALCGSINDLAVRGAEPRYVALSVIAEEGFDEEELKSHFDSAGRICRDERIRLVAGDTKVVPRGAVDGLFLTVAGLGLPRRQPELAMTNLMPGDVLILTGPPGRHGAAIASERYGLATEGLKSDCAPLWGLLSPLLDLPGLRTMRDCTRGGLGTVLCEWTEAAGLAATIDEADLPVDEGVLSVADLLGFDPLYLACEGTALVALAPEEADQALARLRSHPLGQEAALIGQITDDPLGLVEMTTLAGGSRIIDMPIGEILPRIC